ncbi:MAG: NAD(P)/FAD-dependent oxidoreductase [Chloroflexi bacterium]|nr:NAD(P)/FAD-dependent oxidoreductase [Chloroflexota bacterium]MDA1217832.1 NAD(P)/FAD-dependent oxidoreductase [Chloroflexota bacterium]
MVSTSRPDGEERRTERYDVVIVGAGAAGLMCAVEAGKRGRRVLVLEHADRVAKKILISGGGRCNFTNLSATPDDYQSLNPFFCISALTRYAPQDIIDLVEKHRIPYHEKKLGQLFCDGSSREIVRMLLAECESVGVSIRPKCKVTGIHRNNGYLTSTDLGVVASDSLVMATGGPSIPQMGATRFSHEVASQFGLKVTPVRPGLVPLTFSGAALEFCQRLAGLSIPSNVGCNGVSFAENLLFAHHGISGPAILQISSYWTEGESIRVDLLPGFDLAAHLKEQQVSRPRAELATILSALLPRNFVRAMCETSLPNRPISGLSIKDLDSVVETLKAWTLTPSGTEGYRKAEVTLGGVDTTDLSSKTMEAVKVPGLFFIGEAADVTGPLGGYNFQWAWASGFCAGQYV